MSFDCLRISWRSFCASACFFLSSFASAARLGVEANRAIEKISRLTVAILILCAPLLEGHPRSSSGSWKPSSMAGRAPCARSALRVLVYCHGQILDVRDVIGFPDFHLGEDPRLLGQAELYRFPGPP